MCDPTSRNRIRHELLRHLLENPHAQDTCEGIAEWWLGDRAGRRYRTLLCDVLAELIEWGWVAERRTADGQTRYRLAGDHWADVRAFLDREDD